jgi:hypothetical protein
VVVIQYRLGLFGFLAGNGTKDGGGNVNVGLCEYANLTESTYQSSDACFDCLFSGSAVCTAMGSRTRKFSLPPQFALRLNLLLCPDQHLRRLTFP